MMSTFKLILIVHVLAVFVMTAVLAVEAIALAHMRGARTPGEALPWINPVPKISAFAVSSILVILLTGAYLVTLEAASHQPWARVAAGAVLLMAPLGAITGRKMRAIRRGFGQSSESSEEAMTRLRDSFLKMSLGVRVAAFLGIFLLVSTKPGVWASLMLIGAAIVAGLLFSTLSWTRKPLLYAARADAER
jgi:hypothetical protein